MSLLREVMRDNDPVPPANPVRQAQVGARIRRIRLRRRLLAAGTALTATAAAVVVGALALPPPRESTEVVAAPPPSTLPERFTASDGATYTRVGTARVSQAGKKQATMTIPVTGKALDVAATCTGGKESRVSPITSVNGRSLMESSFGQCTEEMDLRPLPVPAGASEVTVRFDTTTVTTRSCFTDEQKKMICEPPERKPDRSVWDLAVYEWTPPATAVVPPEPRAFPSRAEGNRLIDSKSGVWPQDTEVTFQVEGRGRKLGIDQICTGALAARLRFTFVVNGRSTGSSGTCGTWKDGPYPMAISQFEAPKGRAITVKLTWELPGSGEGRPVRWSVGLFERMN